MSSATSMFEVGAVVLGYVGTVASWRRLANNKITPGADYRQLIITSCSSTDDGAHEPAASVTVNGREALLALRTAIDEALSEGGSA